MKSNLRNEIKTGKDGKRYITPEKTAKPDIYNPLKESSEMVLEALNVGMLLMNRSPENEVEKAILAFVTHYGLLGLMTALPTTPSFMAVSYTHLDVYKRQVIMRRVPFPICANCPPSKKACSTGSFVPVKNTMARSAPIEEATTSSRRSTPCDFRYSST